MIKIDYLHFFTYLKVVISDQPWVYYKLGVLIVLRSIISGTRYMDRRIIIKLLEY